MSIATETLAGRGDVLPAELGSKFIRWGLGLFILGFIVGFIPILHYMRGAIAGDVGPAFLKKLQCYIYPCRWAAQRMRSQRHNLDQKHVDYRCSMREQLEPSYLF
jgi:hypothetical protein